MQTLNNAHTIKMHPLTSSEGVASAVDAHDLPLGAHHRALPPTSTSATAVAIAVAVVGGVLPGGRADGRVRQGVHVPRTDTDTEVAAAAGPAVRIVAAASLHGETSSSCDAWHGGEKEEEGAGVKKGNKNVVYEAPHLRPRPCCPS